MIEVCEIFRSIAGETSWVGLPATFIRFSGCNLNCSWCDTQKAKEPGQTLSVEGAVKILDSTNNELVIVTGGEPLLQAGSIDLCNKLLIQGRKVMLETNGSLDISGVPAGVIIILDIKTPSSKEDNKMMLENIKKLKPHDEIKFIIADRADFDWAYNLLQSCKLPEGVNILFSPASDLLDAGLLADWIIKEQLNVRLQIQLHKSIWPQGTDGVMLWPQS